MAALTTAQKAPLIVHDANGIEIDANHRAATVTGTAVHLDNSGAWVIADAPGSATIVVESAGQTGTLDVTVTAAPLAVTLGTPEPK